MSKRAISRDHRSFKVDNTNVLQKAVRHYDAGHYAAVEKICRRVLKRTSASADAYHLLGLVAYHRRDWSTAIARAQQAIANQPKKSEYHVSLGLCHYTKGELQEAIKAYRRALALSVENYAAHVNLAQALWLTSELDSAGEHLNQAILIKPNDHRAWYNYGILLFLKRDLQSALAVFNQCITLKPDFSEAYSKLAMIFGELGATALALEYLQKAVQLKPNGEWVFRLALLMPVIFPSNEAIHIQRKRIQNDLDKLANTAIEIGLPVQEIGAPTFYLAYQGLDDTSIQKQVAELIRRAWHKKPLPSQPVSRSSRIRIGFFSAFFFRHTIARLYRGIIANFDRRRFEVWVLGIKNMDQSIVDAADHVHIVPYDVDIASQKIRNLGLDILFFTEIGMDPLTYYLAYFRIAPVQCVSWGHPVTTGISTIDYFISGKPIEPENAQAHYSEGLMLLDHIPCFYEPLKVTPKPLRDQFGIKATDHLYVCVQSTFKFHPDFDAVIKEILHRDQAAQVILLKGRKSTHSDLLLQRLQGALGALMARVKLLPVLPHHDYLSLLACADVCLDTLHFSGGITTFETLAMGTPVVTWPGHHMRGRVSYGILRVMQLEACIAYKQEDYPALAVSLVCDAGLRSKVRAAIPQGLARLYQQSPLMIRQLEDSLKIAVRKANESTRTCA